ncbi:MAG: hypothetical protein M1837_004991 [Sclerophora amabilis]|nr:MAG: hypothetical protein M1837_004991 [Sclerophora amabilis]
MSSSFASEGKTRKIPPMLSEQTRASPRQSGSRRNPTFKYSFNSPRSRDQFETKLDGERRKLVVSGSQMRAGMTRGGRAPSCEVERRTERATSRNDKKTRWRPPPPKGSPARPSLCLNLVPSVAAALTSSASPATTSRRHVRGKLSSPRALDIRHPSDASRASDGSAQTSDTARRRAPTRLEHVSLPGLLTHPEHQHRKSVPSSNPPAANPFCARASQLTRFGSAIRSPSWGDRVLLMVLFKRKPVQYLSPPPIEDENAEVWVIGPTGELFVDYESYLHRMDFYKQRRFICEITGHSSLTFFDALQSEMEGSKDVDQSFPDALKEPVLRKVQFSTISRIDNLVDFIYDKFKEDFYPGENVTVMIDSGERLSGVVREKAKFPDRINQDGVVDRKAFSRYFVALRNRPDEEALVDDGHIFRDRKIFTKQMLRGFIKNTVTREAWTGAPWLVKERAALSYKIDTDVPAHLKYGNKVMEKKAQQKRGDHDETRFSSPLSQQHRLPELKPATKSHKSKQLQQQIARDKQQQFLDYQRALARSENLAVPYSAQSNGHPQFIHANFPSFAPAAAKGSPKPAPPPPIKYPIEDLDISPSRDGTQRPSLKFLSGKSHDGAKDQRKCKDGVPMESVGPLLETWETLNVYCEIFHLDSFTFDDYVDALQLSSLEVDCELFVEIHCAILKILVDEESKGGKLQVTLPEIPEDDDSEDEESGEDTSAMPSATPEPEVKPAGRTTRSSLAKSEAAEIEKASQSETIEARPHRASEMLASYGWIERLRKREFKNGGWEIILIGLLDQLGRKPKYSQICERILVKLAPIDQEPTQETARVQYAVLDFELRVKVLQIVCLLTVESKAIRGYMEECSEQMTIIRKEKIELQRTRKAIMEELRLLNEERKILLPDNSPPSPVPELEVNGDSKMTGIDQEDEEEVGTDSDDEEPHNSRSLRRGVDRAAERKRKRDAERDKKEKAEAAAKLPKISTRFKKILKDINKKKEEMKRCEDEISTRDNDLREADCPRARCLGKDRFWNRYWWFERNGMPYAGLPTSSTADAGYANGCVWVQGPDELERQGFIDLSEQDEQRYRKAFRMTVPERKELEEGRTSLATAFEWGFYDDADSLDMLIGWLDLRGNRESKLRKELQLQRAKICLYMENRSEYLRDSEDKSVVEEPPTRISTRTKTYIDSTSHRCLSWRNTTALEELGHLHSEQPRQRKATRKSDPDKETRIRATNRQGKPVGRQGTRYDF